ncbi:GNAT family N-acetyltransferase [Mucilaginibacter aquaedulcis]|uniref:GNAT family N-acetyltransferase n=1 Tax=Mucilaginibacter aquaedulcis TaxID=1187081 RepID=UPI0025B5E157|nr:GNAT family N-acetyltransferase [Mucilaginibacter aquaedulcis]MDN3547666.1 GNAT family N-acetyltransferase [Mucilaginibacter aquaedulcis]
MNDLVQTTAYTIERLNSVNINDVAALHNIVYNRAIPKEFFAKKYDTAYTGTSYIGYIAYNASHLPIAYYGVIPTLISYDGGIILAAQSADTMTHPKFRYAGLFTTLAKQTFDLCTAEEIKLIFGFPNQNSLPGFIGKLQWQITEYMDCFMIPVKGGQPLERLVNKFSFLKPAYNLYENLILKKFLAQQRGISSSISVDHYNGVLRGESYLKYKTYSPTRVIQIDQSKFWIKFQNGMTIGDAEINKIDFVATMGKLIELARKLGVSQIQFHTSPNTSLHALFAEHYQPVTSFPIIFKDLGSGVSLENIKFTFADIDVF